VSGEIPRLPLMISVRRLADAQLEAQGASGEAARGDLVLQPFAGMRGRHREAVGRRGENLGRLGHRLMALAHAALGWNRSPYALRPEAPRSGLEGRSRAPVDAIPAASFGSPAADATAAQMKAA